MNDKQRLAYAAANLVKDDMLVGLGTGSTADYFIEELGRRVREENLRITTASSSMVSMLKAQKQGLPLISIEHLNHLDIYIDGADEVTPDNTLLKGQGADLVKEKLLARASKQFIVLVDSSKLVEYIGAHFPIPIEVMPFAWQLVKHDLEQYGAQGDLRKNGNGLAMSSHGSLILDMKFPASLSSAQLNTLLNNTPGIVEHGVFYQLTHAVLLATNDEVQILTQP